VPHPVTGNPLQGLRAAATTISRACTGAIVRRRLLAIMTTTRPEILAVVMIDGGLGLGLGQSAPGEPAA